MSKVIVFGSLNMDLSIEAPRMPQLGETINGGNFITNPGGKGANQAVAAAKMGGEVWMLGAVGGDAFGQQMRESLEASGVHRGHAHRRCRDHARRRRQLHRAERGRKPCAVG